MTFHENQQITHPIQYLFHHRLWGSWSQFLQNAHLIITHHIMQGTIFRDSAGWPGLCGSTLQLLANNLIRIRDQSPLLQDLAIITSPRSITIIQTIIMPKYKAMENGTYIVSLFRLAPLLQNLLVLSSSWPLTAQLQSLPLAILSYLKVLHAHIQVSYAAMYSHTVAMVNKSIPKQ